MGNRTELFVHVLQNAVLNVKFLNTQTRLLEHVSLLYLLFGLRHQFCLGTSYVMYPCVGYSENMLVRLLAAVCLFQAHTFELLLSMEAYLVQDSSNPIRIPLISYFDWKYMRRIRKHTEVSHLRNN